MKVGGQTVDLELPPRLVVRHDLSAAAVDCKGREQTARRVVAAALLLCWPGVGHKAGRPGYRGDVLEYGGEAIDFLLGNGATMDEIIEAGNAALQMVIDDAVTDRHLGTARGNSTAPAGSSSRGGSSDGGGSGGAG